MRPQFFFPYFTKNKLPPRNWKERKEKEEGKSLFPLFLVIFHSRSCPSSDDRRHQIEVVRHARR